MGVAVTIIRKGNTRECLEGYTGFSSEGRTGDASWMAAGDYQCKVHKGAHLFAVERVGTIEEARDWLVSKLEG